MNNTIEIKNEDDFLKSYKNVLNICFSKKPELIKFDSNSTDDEIDSFFDSL